MFSTGVLTRNLSTAHNFTDNFMCWPCFPIDTMDTEDNPRSLVRRSKPLALKFTHAVNRIEADPRFICNSLASKIRKPQQ